MKSEFDGLVEYLFNNHILLPEAVGLLEKRMIECALRHCENKQLTASKQLGIHRNTLQRKMIEYAIGNDRARIRKKPAGRAAPARKRKNSAA